MPAVLRLMLGNLASKFLGLAREVLFASWFGTSEVAAAFRIAQSLIFISIHSLIGDTLAGSMLPLYQRFRGESEEKGRALLAIALMQGLLIGMIISLCMFFLSHQIVNLMAPGASVSAKTMAALMVQIMSIVAPIYIVGNTLAYIESAHGKYTTLSSRTSLANVGIILAGAAAVYLKQPMALAIGFVLVYTVFLAATIADFVKTGLSGFILGHIAKPLFPIVRIFEANIFSLLGLLFVSQGNVFLERVVASWLGTSVIPGLDYARFLTDTLSIMLAVPLGIVTLASHGGSTKEVLKEHSAKITRMLLILTIPVSLMLFVSAKDVITIVYARGAFNAQSVAITSDILRGAACGVFGTITAYFLVKSLNTALRNKESLILTLIAAIVNVAFNMLFWRQLGPICLGIGNALFGVVLLVGCLSLMGLWSNTLKLLLKNLATAAAAGAIIIFLPHTSNAFINVAMNGGIILAMWLALYTVSADIRQSAEPITLKVFSMVKKLKRG